MVSRLRSPRYALALLLGAGYLALVFFGQRHSSAAAVPAPAVQLGGALLLAVLLGKWWLFGADRLALAFAPAEIQFLFPAPVSRAQLLGYKLLRSQFAVLLSVLIWMALLRRGRGSPLPAAAYALSLWAIFNTLFFHRLGVALTRDAVLEAGRAAVKRLWPVLAAVVAGFGLLLWELGRGYVRVGAGSDAIGQIGQLLERPPLAWILLPLRLPFLPLAAESLAEWLPRFLAAAGVAALHALWVVRADRSFEESAIEASARRAELLDRWRRHGGPAPARVRRARHWFRLRPAGHPIGAIVWKNLTRLVRTASPAMLISFGVVAAVLIGYNLFAGAGETGGTLIGTLALGWLGMLTLLGPQWIRIDLRGELDHLSLLRSWPVSGLELMSGQVFSSALVLTALQAVLGVIVLTALAGTAQALSPASFATLSTAGVLALGGLNVVSLGLQNGAALLFPGWIRTDGRPGGIEAMGQQLLAAGISVVVLLLAALGPGLLAGAVIYFARGILGEWSLLPALLLGAAGLGLEAFLLLDWLGSRFERGEEG
jgi:hypothetical protein